jgi:hypothetical protein
MDTGESVFDQLAELFCQDRYPDGIPEDLTPDEVVDQHLDWLIQNGNDPIVRELLNQWRAEAQEEAFRRTQRNGEGH